MIVTSNQHIIQRMSNGEDNPEVPVVVSQPGGMQTGAQQTPAVATMPMMFAPPVITANMMPQPNASVEKQSAEEWFKVFKVVADSLISIYEHANQGVVGQRQALATLPSLLNRNESEKRLATRIISECNSVEEAGLLITKTIGDLESECQAAESIFLMKRGQLSLEDFYAQLLEKEKKARLGTTTIIKKFISELPKQMKPKMHQKFSEYRITTPAGELTDQQVERLYILARRIYNEQYNTILNQNVKTESAFNVVENPPNASKSDEELKNIIAVQNSSIRDMQEKLDAFMVSEKKFDSRRIPRCFHCDKPGHVIRDCRFLQGRNQQQRGNQTSKSENTKGRDDKSRYGYCQLPLNENRAMMVKGRLNGKAFDMLVDTGAGPCIIGLNKLKNICKEDITVQKSGKMLKGLGSVKSLGTIILPVSLPSNIKKDQEFIVVENLDVVLLGCKFLSKFDKLEVNWKSMKICIDGKEISGEAVLCGGELSTRINFVDEKSNTSMKTEIWDHVSKNPYITSKEKDELYSLLLEYADVFISNPKNPPEAKLVSHVIDTGNAQPVRDKMRRFPPSWTVEIEKQISEMLKNGICRKSNSPWSSQVLLVRKKDGTMRFVIDYRKLNDHTKRDDYPMPNLKDMIDDLKDSKYFSCMDLPSAYWHIKMDDSSIEKTAFEVPHGKFEMLRMPYGLKNSQSTQQRYMDETLSQVKNTKAYVDNIFTHSNTYSEHLSNLRQCLEQIRKQNLSLRIDKCDFAKTKVEQFGFIISSHGVSPSEENVLKLRQYPRPNCSKELRRFLGMANYYREFISKYAERVEPLQQLLRKNSTFDWCEPQEKSFNEIKKEISSKSLLNYPDWNKPFIIELDGSKVAACGILMQETEGKRNILSYHSSTLDQAQRNYSPTELECWAAISACRRFNTYIKGAPKLILRSDHKPLQWLRNQKDPRGKFSRWMMELEQYNYQFEYKPGVENLGADALSRIDIGKCPSDSENDDEFVYVPWELHEVYGKEEWKKLLQTTQSKDPSIRIAEQQLEEHNSCKIS